MKQISYNLLLKKKKNELITYREKLQVTEWKNKRQQIISRDNNKCRKCNKEEYIPNRLDSLRNMTKQEEKEYIDKQYNEFIKTETGKLWIEMVGGIQFGIPMVKKENYIEKDTVILHVHHQYYIKNKLPWEYPNNSLITLCHNCHQEEHNQNDIPEYTDERMLSKSDLTKCSRCNGSGYLEQFHYVKNGICFRCNGNKYDQYI